MAARGIPVTCLQKNAYKKQTKPVHTKTIHLCISDAIIQGYLLSELYKLSSITFVIVQCLLTCLMGFTWLKIDISATDIYLRSLHDVQGEKDNFKACLISFSC